MNLFLDIRMTYHTHNSNINPRTHTFLPAMHPFTHQIREPQIVGVWLGVEQYAEDIQQIEYRRMCANRHIYTCILTVGMLCIVLNR